MIGPDLDKYIEAGEKGGGIKKGPMTGPDQQQHRALMAQAYTEKHQMMMQLGMVKKSSKTFGSVPTPKKSTEVFYQFREDNDVERAEGRKQGVVKVRLGRAGDGPRELLPWTAGCFLGQFEKYLLDDQNGYVPGKLTTTGASAHIALKRLRAKADKRNASRERKKKRQEK